MPVSLPTISRNAATTPADLIRFFHQAQLHWARHLGEETEFDIGTAIVNARLPELPLANCIFDAALTEGMPASHAMEIVTAHFQQSASRCRAWITNPSAPQQQVHPLLEHLMASGYRPNEREILYLRHSPGSLAEMSGLTIIPARASFRHVRQLARNDQAADAALRHLDDPHVDSLLALRGGAVLAQTTVLSMGEIGLIAELFVAPEYRRQGIGRTMLGRAMEIAARSLFKHVFASATPGEAAAAGLFTKAGFVVIGRFTQYQAEL